MSEIKTSVSYYANKTISYYDRIKTVDSKTQSIVYGFIQRIEAMLHRTMIIPFEIVSICLLYYFNPEYFTIHGKNITLLDKNQAIKGGKSSAGINLFGTAYGNVEINTNNLVNCIWTFEINKHHINDIIGIGISSSKKLKPNEYRFYKGRDTRINGIDIEEFFARLLNPSEVKETNESSNIKIDGYAYENNSIMLERSKESASDYGCIFGDGDIVQMEFNPQNKTLRYFVNSKDQGIAAKDIQFDGIYESYVMAVFIKGTVEVKLMNFQGTYKT
eukprot:129041_1